MFVMISGALFLDRDLPLKKIFGKYVLRMAVSFAVWSVAYAYLSDWAYGNRITMIIGGHYHIWFLPMITGLYLCIPFFRAIIGDRKRTVYFLVLAFGYAFLLPQAVSLLQVFAGGQIGSELDAFKRELTRMDIHTVLGYSSYFILGWCLSKEKFGRGARLFTYLLGGAGLFSTVWLNRAVSLHLQQASAMCLDEFTVGVLFTSIAVFVWFKSRSFRFERLNRLVQKLSQYSFGAFLVHVLVIQRLAGWFGLTTLSFEPALSVPVLVFLTAVVSFAISAVLNQIPVIRKYAV